VRSRAINRAAVATLSVFFSVGAGLAQTATTKPALPHRTAALKPASESPEHRAFRIRYEGAVEECDRLVAYAESVIDKGAAAGPPIVCAPTGRGSDVQNLVANLKEQNRALEALRKILDGACEGCSSEGQLNAAIKVLESASVGGSSYEKLKDLRTLLEHVDPCVTLYHATIDKKASDLTVRESELIAGCRGLDLYPPSRAD
jgi:hypothetical protein